MLHSSFIELAIGLTSLVAVIAAGLITWPALVTNLDIYTFRVIASELDPLIMNSSSPTLLSSMYPPLTSVIFWITYKLSYVPFALAWTVFIIVFILASTLWVAQRFQAVLPVTIFLFSIFMSMYLLGTYVFFARYDLIVGTSILLAWKSFELKRYRLSTVLIAAAFCLKYIPVILLPFFLIMAPRKSWRPLAEGVLIGAIFFLLLPTLLIGIRNTVTGLAEALPYHAQRAVQAETTWSGLYMLSSALNSKSYNIELRSFTNVITDLDSTHIHTVAPIIMLVGLLFMYIHAYRYRRTGNIEIYLFAALLWFLFTTDITSPQYITWVLIPLLVFLLQHMDNSWYTATLFLAAGLVGLATMYVYPLHYTELLLQQSIGPVIVLNIRNVLFLTVLLLIWHHPSFGLRHAVRRKNYKPAFPQKK